MKPIEDALVDFLASKTLKVAALKGEWGAGKTFFWREFLGKRKTTLPFRGYSYASLFGIGSTSDLLKQICANFEILREDKATKHLERLKPLGKLLNRLEVPYFDAGSVMQELIETYLINDFLICIDDLERKEEDMSTASILGLISRLKEEKNCKIVLIYNEEELDGPTAKAINEYREKVVDIELLYSPTLSSTVGSEAWNSRDLKSRPH